MIRVENISKTFKVHQKAPGLVGSLKSLFNRKWIEKKALANVSFEVKEGEIVGLIGSNGAGKTTLAKILSGIVHPTSGKAEVMGHVPWQRKNSFRRNMALIMGQKASLWWDLPAMDCYLLLKEIYQINNNDFEDRLNYLANALDVKDELNIQIRRLSLGERMKAELIAALLHNPKVVYLDEPTIGLDLTAQKAIRDFLLEYREKYNPIMILTSHYMEDIEKLCERIVILKEGELVYDGALAKIKASYNQHKVIHAHINPENDCNQEFSWDPNFGELVEQTDDFVKIKVEKEKLSKAVERLVTQCNLHDLGIEELDISDIIEEVIRKGV